MSNNDNCQLIKLLYERFNARDIDGVLAALTTDAAWANGLEGGHVYGPEAVREYWTLQWQVINPRVEPVSITEDSAGIVVVEVHQIVHDLEGNLLLDEQVTHLFTMQQGSVKQFDIQGVSKLSAVKTTV